MQNQILIMNSSTITVHWHDDNQPVYSVDFQPVTNETMGSSTQTNTLKGAKSPRLATGGGDNNVRIWKLGQTSENPQVEYLSTLRKHTQAVNVVRFNQEGTTLATAGDDGTIILWKLSPTIVKEFGEEDDDVKESWIAQTVIRSSTSEIYDICWSPDGKYLASGSMDHILRIYDVNSGNLIHQLNNHNHYIQGITWDPKNEFLVSQSTDRSVNVYKLQHAPGALMVNHINKVAKVEIPASKLSSKPDSKFKTSMIYHSETLQSFFRRLTFSPDGSLLLSPSGIYRYDDDKEQRLITPQTTNDNDGDAIEKKDEKEKEKEGADKETNTVYIFIRSALNRPVVHLPGMKKPAIAISFSPIYYKAGSDPVFKLPYKMVFAVATQDSVIVYDTCNLQPLGLVSNLHYSSITDLKWDKDGMSIVVGSADGFCSVVRFEDGVFGEEIGEKEVSGATTTIGNSSSTSTLDIGTPGTTGTSISKAAPLSTDTGVSVLEQTTAQEIIEITGSPMQIDTRSPKATDLEKSPKPKKNTIVNLLKVTKKEKKRVIPTLVEQ